nr:hypothetical protein [Tanacetum cinerariifolium]
CHHKQFLCIHDDVDDLIESALDYKLLSINSQRLDKKEQEVKIVEEQPVERRNRAEDECEATSEDKRECDELVCDNYSDTFSNSKIDDISVYDDDFEDIEYIEASLLDPEISFPEYDSFCFEIEPDQERLINLVENDISDNSSNDPLLEEVDLFLSDNSIPLGIENVAYNPEGDIRFLEKLHIDDSILSHELFDANFEDNPLIPRPPPEPPDDNFSSNGRN